MLRVSSIKIISSFMHYQLNKVLEHFFILALLFSYHLVFATVFKVYQKKMNLLKKKEKQYEDYMINFDVVAFISTVRSVVDNVDL